MATLVINTSGAGTGTLTLAANTAPISTLTLAGNGVQPITLSGINSATTSAFVLNDSVTGASGGAQTVTAFALSAAPSFTINDSSTKGLTIATFTDTSLVSSALSNTGTATLTVSGLVNTAANVFTTLTLTGSGAETVTALTFAGNTSGNLVINDSNTGTVTLSAISEAARTTGNLTVTNSGNGNLVISTLVDAATVAGTDSFINQGSGTFSVTMTGGAGEVTSAATLNFTATSGLMILGGGAFTDNFATSINLTNNVSGFSIADSVTTGVTITQTGANANPVAVSLSGTNTVANTYNLGTVTGGVTIAGGAGVDTMTVGNGTNTLTPGAGNDAITLATTHTNATTISQTTAVNNGTDTYANFIPGTDVFNLSIGGTISVGGTVITPVWNGLTAGGKTAAPGTFTAAIAILVPSVEATATTTAAATFTTGNQVLVLSGTLIKSTTDLAAAVKAALTVGALGAQRLDELVLWSDGVNSYLSDVSTTTHVAAATVLTGDTVTATNLVQFTGVTTTAGFTAAGLTFIA